MEQKHLKWRSLRENRCPRCGHSLAQHATVPRLFCAASWCGFSISHEAFVEIVGEKDEAALERLGYSMSL